jgi:hypothetical protein
VKSHIKLYTRAGDQARATAYHLHLGILAFQQQLTTKEADGRFEYGTSCAPPWAATGSGWMLKQILACMINADNHAQKQ